MPDIADDELVALHRILEDHALPFGRSLDGTEAYQMLLVTGAGVDFNISCLGWRFGAICRAPPCRGVILLIYLGAADAAGVIFRTLPSKVAFRYFLGPAGCGDPVYCRVRDGHSATYMCARQGSETSSSK